MIIGISGKLGSGKDTVAGIINYLIWKRGVEEGSTKSLNGTLEDFLEGRPKTRFENKKFADKLKEIVCLLIGCTREQLEDREFKEKELGEEWWLYELISKDFANAEKLNYKYYDKKLFSTKQEAEKTAGLSGLKDYEINLIKPTPRRLLQLLGTEAGRDIIHPNIWVNALMSEYKPYNTGGTIASNGGFKLKEPLIYPNWIITDMRFPNELKAVKDRDGITIRINRFDGLTAGQIAYEKPHLSETALDNAEFDYVIDNNGTMEQLAEKVKQILIKENIL